MTETSPPEIKTPDDLRKFLQDTENALTVWANKKIEATGYVDAVIRELHTHQISFHFWSMGRFVEIIEAMGARITELENKLNKDWKETQ